MRVPHIIVIYDSIFNSVFESQVLIPALLHSDRQIIILSFERTLPCLPLREKMLKKYPHVQWIFLPRVPFITSLLLYIDRYRLKRVVKRYTSFYLQARGPLAGFVVQKAALFAGCLGCVIQIRGLLAEEYRYSNARKGLLPVFRYKMFRALEQKAYSYHFPNLTYEVVSPALQAYAVQHFNTPASSIIVAQRDIPSLYPENIRKQWRLAVRKELGLTEERKVYCYNGSAKAWQCPEMVVRFFHEKYMSDAHSFLLVLTQDVEVFKKLLENMRELENNFHIMHVIPQEIYRYLAASDVGLLFRKPHIINWVSRPTKMLEYQAVGLPIEHNNTVGWLVQKDISKEQER